MADSKGETSPVGVIDLTGDDDDIGLGMAASSASKESTNLASVRKRLSTSPPTSSTTDVKKIKIEPRLKDPPSYALDNGDKKIKAKDPPSYTVDDEVQIVAATERRVVAAIAAAAGNRDPDVQVVGTIGHVKLPHMRQHCTDFPFAEYNEAASMRYCEECYCYVCDDKAKKCTKWSTHYRATDKGPCASQWMAMRAKVRAHKTSMPAAVATARTQHVAGGGYLQQRTPPGRRPIISATAAAAAAASRSAVRSVAVPQRASTATRVAPQVRRSPAAGAATGSAATNLSSVASAPAVTAAVTAAVPAVAAAAAQSVANAKAVVAASLLPVPAGYHMRFACPVKGFKPMRYVDEVVVGRNSSYCDNCYCFVCDKPASQCHNWYQPPECGYTSEDSYGDWWGDGERYGEDENYDDLNHCNAENFGPVKKHWSHLRMTFKFTGLGPWRPDHPDAVDGDTLMQCRKCGWYSKKSLQGYCAACGLIAKADSLTPPLAQQGIVFEPSETHRSLGTRQVDFGIEVRDPRTMSQYEARWKDPANKWHFNESEFMQDEVGRRFGKYATLSSLCDVSSTGPSRLVFAAVGLTAITIDNTEDKKMLLSLNKASPSFGKQGTGAFVGDITVSWKPSTRKATATVRLYVDLSKKCDPLEMLIFAGHWYRTLRPELKSLVGPLRPVVDKSETWDFRYESIPHALINADNQKKAKATRDKLVDAVNKSIPPGQETLTPSSGKRLVGGICGNQTTFEGVSLRFIRECLPDLVTRAHSFDNIWAKRVLLSHAAGHVLPGAYTAIGLDHIFNQDDQVVLSSLIEDATAFKQNIRQLNMLISHLENLGHAEADFVEGLTVELLPFQRQSLKWALERETISGGMQSYWTVELPHTIPPLYYNFVTGQFTAVKPNLVRGGIIAEQMGLGKTVISLALILSNPAPEFPVTGSSASTIGPISDAATSFRDPALFAKTCGASKKRGSIVSRGTLVVCNVSLVGQWIDEAKSKLADPGLVYSYHGAGRRRDPSVLAQNSIVVTTYETLASDVNFHSKKSGLGDNYCAPCEQVRWWRIICDESHVLRTGSTHKTKAVMQLVADNKWLVSGTPISTSLRDLENQMLYLGIHDARDMMKTFRNGVMQSIGDPQSKTGRGELGGSAWQSLPYGRFTFLMRSVLMRHSQNQKYAGTTTTLMSLPPKTENVVEIPFAGSDVAEYEAVENAAKAFYLNFDNDPRKHYLLLTSKLLPLRIACAGGRIPVEEPSSPGGAGDNEMDDEDAGQRKRPAKIQKFSDHAYTSKLNKLIAELKSVRDDDPTSKSLVFSQFASTLEWLKIELPKHGFQFRSLSGDMTMSKRAKALREFQNDPPTTIFLLSMRAGACGINLTQANRVFIMEPCFNPALEAQAIGRVHRLGQTRPVKVTRLIMKDSVESRLRKMLENKYGKDLNATVVADVEDDGDSKPAATGNAVVAIGSLRTDKAAATSDDFDLLFGVTQGNVRSMAQHHGGGSSAVPDSAGSSERVTL